MLRLVTFQKVFFRFVRNTFHLDQATYFRSSVVKAVWRMAFVITGTTSAQFTRNLTKWHTQFVTTDNVCSFINAITSSLWPEGIWYTPGPSLNADQQRQLEDDSREKLKQFLPDQVRQIKSVLGDDFDKGIDTLHEIIQNKVVLKTLTYTLLDLLLLELFPEIEDELLIAKEKVVGTSDIRKSSRY